MRSKFAMIALSGFAISALSLGGILLTGGPADAAAFSIFGLPRCDFEPTGRSATRRLAWDGSDTAGIAVPASVHYRRGQGDQVVVTGDSAVVSHVRIVDGAVQFDCRARNLRDTRLEVTLPGRAFKGFSLAGAGDLTLDNIDQPDLKINVAGSGNIAASGKAGSLELHVAGAGEAKLNALAVDRVAINIAGSGNIEIAPKDDLKANIIGSGTLTLHSEPHSIETHVIGSGRIVHPDGTISGRSHV